MAMKENVITLEGLKKIEQELDYLKSTKRQEVAATIKEALSFGDISENAEYDEAKNEQARMEEKIVQLENLLKHVKVIDEDDIKTDVVNVGCKVTVYDYEFEEEVEYSIVGSAETNPLEFKISNESPVGSTLIGAKIGDEVKVMAPDGALTLKILKINK